MNKRAGRGPFDSETDPILHAGGNRSRARRAAAILLAVGLIEFSVAAEDAGQIGATPEIAVPQAADPVFGAFSSLHARQQWLEAEIVRHQDRLAEAASGFTAAQRALQEKEAVIAELRSQLTRLEQTNGEIDAARRELTAENAKFAATLAQERIRSEADAQALRDRAEELKKRLSALESEDSATRSRFVELEQGRDQALSANLLLQAEKRELEGEVERQAQTRVELTRRIESLEATLELMKTEREVLSDEKDTLAEDLAQSALRIDDLSLELGRNNGDQQQHKERLHGLAESASSLEVQLAEQSEAANLAIARAEQAEKRLAELEESNAELQSRSEDLRASLDKAEAEAARLEAQRTDQLAAAEGTADDAQRNAAEKVALEDSRRTAREAAMDAERRLKVVEETHAGAVAAVEMLQRDKAELQTSLENEREKAMALQASVDEVRRRAAELELQGEAAGSAAAERDRLAAQNQALADELAQLKQAGSVAGQSAQAQLDAKEAEIADLHGQIGELQATLGRTESELQTIREQIPVAAGGSLTADQLRQKAAEQMQALQEHDKKRGEMDGAQWKERRAELKQAVYDEQLNLAQSLSAQGVHRVQRDDTLAGISHEAYGRSNRWNEIFEVNRHLLDDADRVFPGMTLITP